ncbi:MAG: insulinase family protein [Chrysiogenales bacterium]|nr:MAG: insulinase family protein [Chrysiogenales bacterium]
MVEKTVLPCGLTVISENFPEFPSFALSYSLKSGSRAETADSNGVHHLIEHMLFKGSRRHDLKQIADISDRLGGRLNAFTSKEITQYYIKSIDEKLNESFALLSDIVFHSTFPEDEFVKEKNVIIQEIKEADDNPETNAFETFYEKIYAGNALGYPIGGREKHVAGLNRGQVFTFYREHYIPENMLLSAAGNIRHRELVALASDFFAAYPPRTPRQFKFPRARFRPRRFHKKNKTLNQCYVLTALDSISLVSHLRHPIMIMNDILGGGMSSRLFQSIREEKGLAYTVSSFIDSYQECGVQLIYAVIEPDKVSAYLEAVRSEIGRLKKKGISDEELERAKDHIKSSIILSLENNVAKMRFNTGQELYFGKEQKVADIISEINATTSQDINGFCGKYLDLDQAALLTYGRCPKNQDWKVEE